MEESSNGKLEEVEKVVKEDSGQLETEDESFRVVVVDGDPESVKANNEGSDKEAEADEKSPQVVDLEGFKEEKVVTNELNDGEVAPEDATKVDSKGTQETTGVSEEVSHQASDGVSSVVTEVIKQPPLPVAITQEVSTAMEETEQPASINNSGESSHIVNVESKEKEDESLPALANPANVDNTTDKPEVLQNNENPPIVSLSQRTVRPTSWISCCGLLEALRRTD